MKTYNFLTKVPVSKGQLKIKLTSKKILLAFVSLIYSPNSRTQPNTLRPAL